MELRIFFPLITESSHLSEGSQQHASTSYSSRKGPESAGWSIDSFVGFREPVQPEISVSRSIGGTTDISLREVNRRSWTATVRLSLPNHQNRTQGGDCTTTQPQVEFPLLETTANQVIGTKLLVTFTISKCEETTRPSYQSVSWVWRQRTG